jgi:hypothetical protein
MNLGWIVSFNVIDTFGFRPLYLAWMDIAVGIFVRERIAFTSIFVIQITSSGMNLENSLSKKIRSLMTWYQSFTHIHFRRS